MNVSDLIRELTLLQETHGDLEVEVHTQPRYPLKGTVELIRELEGKASLAISCEEGYGSRRAWVDPEDECECEGEGEG